MAGLSSHMQLHTCAHHPGLGRGRRVSNSLPSVIALRAWACAQHAAAVRGSSLAAPTCMSCMRWRPLMLPPAEALSVFGTQPSSSPSPCTRVHAHAHGRTHNAIPTFPPHAPLPLPKPQAGLLSAHADALRGNDCSGRSAAVVGRRQQWQQVRHGGGRPRRRTKAVANAGGRRRG